MPNISNIIKILQITEQIVPHEPFIYAEHDTIFLPIDSKDIEKHPELFAKLVDLGVFYAYDGYVRFLV